MSKNRNKLLGSFISTPIKLPKLDSLTDSDLEKINLSAGDSSEDILKFNIAEKEEDSCKKSEQKNNNKSSKEVKRFRRKLMKYDFDPNSKDKGKSKEAGNKKPLKRLKTVST